MTRAPETAAPTSRSPEPPEADGIPTERGDAAAGALPPATVPTEDPEVGLAQKGSGEDAVIRRETAI
ncbi:hypothetical protein ACLBXO_16630 [Methylobacterium sp. C33D]|uniref:hypothetical protein n=1 Tax=Methylobacterium mesophilicum TaxID=39956 RepID=UPI002F30BC1B